MLEMWAEETCVRHASVPVWLMKSCESAFDSYFVCVQSMSGDSPHLLPGRKGMNCESSCSMACASASEVVPGRPLVSEEDTARTVLPSNAGTSLQVCEMSVKARESSEPNRPTGSDGIPSSLCLKNR